MADKICRIEFKNKVSEQTRISSLKPMQKRTANYRHLWNPVNPLMPGGNKRSYILEVAGLFK